MTARLVVAGTHSGVGKTTVATGLMAALAARGHTVAGFKVGPDFIDPSYHEVATGRASRNLDAFLSGPDLLGPLFAHGSRGADIAVVEGVMGLFDGAGADGTASTAHVAKLLDAPVVLVVDVAAMAGSVAALVHGFATFDPALRVAGVIANRFGSPRHATLVAEALAPLGIPLLGALPRSDDVTTPARHLGLIPVAERKREARRTVRALAECIAANVDLRAVVALAQDGAPIAAAPWHPAQHHGPRVPVAVAAGPAFSFSYPENLELLAAAGADIATFDPTTDSALPPARALYLGGGFPERYAEALSANVALRSEITAFAACGRPVLAECGGLLYLCRTLDGRPQCAVLPADARMTERVTLGYRHAEAASASNIWCAGERARGHEFHYSTVTPAAGASPAWRVRSTHGDQTVEGFVAAGVHASYLHTHWAATPHIPTRLVRAAQAVAA